MAFVVYDATFIVFQLFSLPSTLNMAKLMHELLTCGL